MLYYRTDGNLLNNDCDDLLGVSYNNKLSPSFEIERLKQDGMSCVGLLRCFLVRNIGSTLPHMFIRDIPQYLLEELSFREISPNADDFQFGDIVFFRNSTRIAHVGVFLSDDDILHSALGYGVVKEKRDIVIDRYGEKSSV